MTPATRRASSTGSARISTRAGASEGGERDEEKLHWIGIRLEDADGNPVPEESYEVKMPTGEVVSGRLDAEGRARIEGLPEGKCEVNFPELHDGEWKAK